MRKQRITISVIGGSSISSRVEDLAESVGKMIAELGCILVCGGLGGAMEAAAMGAKKGRWYDHRYFTRQGQNRRQSPY